MTDTPQLLLAHHLKTLKLPTFLREYEKVAGECAREVVDHPRYLLRLAELELIDRERRLVERRIRDARFPAVKSLDTFNFTAMPSLNKPLVLELARCEFVVTRDNVIAFGNSGTGKTHVALALGMAACQRGFSVIFVTAAGLIHQLQEARDERRLLRLQQNLAAAKLLIIESWAMPHSRRPGRSCCSRSSASTMSEARPSLPPICRSRNGQVCSVPNGRLARCSTGSPTTSISWR